MNEQNTSARRTPDGRHGTGPRRTVRRAAVLVVGAMVTLCGCGAATDDGALSRPVGPKAATASPDHPQAADQKARLTPARSVLPGVGPGTLAGIPDGSRQALLVTGAGRNKPVATVRLYERTADGWKPKTAVWPAHNALKGWTDDHRLGDMRSPVGVFTLTAAGGRLADPGTRLPYFHSGGFSIGGTGFHGEPLAGSFDYVVAIDYNHRRGTSPQDWTRPLGASRGGGIWMHVDHGGPTQGCVSIAEKHMKELLLALSPEKKPVVVMGDTASLSR